MQMDLASRGKLNVPREGGGGVNFTLRIENHMLLDRGGGEMDFVSWKVIT